ncbi:hypothetical protein SprV_0100114700 [Sparganum proliferum]
MDVYRDERPGIRIAYRTDGHLNYRRMQFQLRESTTAVHELLFADVASQRQRPTHSNVPMVSIDIPDTNWTCLTHSDQMQHPDSTNRRLSVHLSLAFHAVN